MHSQREEVIREIGMREHRPPEQGKRGKGEGWHAWRTEDDPAIQEGVLKQARGRSHES